MARQSKIGIYGRYTPTPVDDSKARVAEAYGNLAASVGGSIASVIEKNVTRKAVKEGKLAGLKQGATGEYQEAQNAGTIYSDAYNEAMQTSYLATQDTKIKEQLSSIYTNNNNDIEGYMAAAQGMRKGILDNAPDEIKPILAMSLDEMISSTGSRVESNQYTTNMTNAQEDIQASIEASDAEIETAMTSGDFDGVVTAIEKQKAKLLALRGMNESDGRYGITETQYREGIRQIEVSATIAGNRGKMKQLFKNKGLRSASDFYIGALLMDKPLDQFTSDDQDVMIQQLGADLAKYNKIEVDRLAASDKGIKAFQRTNFAEIEMRINGGDEMVTADFLAIQLRNNLIDEEQYGKLNKRLQTRGMGTRNVPIYNSIKSLINTGKVDTALDTMEYAKETLMLTDADYAELQQLALEKAEETDPEKAQIAQLKSMLESTFVKVQGPLGAYYNPEIEQELNLSMILFDNLINEGYSAEYAYQTATRFKSKPERNGTIINDVSELRELAFQKMPDGTVKPLMSEEEYNRLEGEIIAYDAFLNGLELAKTLDALRKTPFIEEQQ